MHYSSHLPCLIRAVQQTRGPILELGCGYFSTPILHWLCEPTRRPLVSYETDPRFVHALRTFVTDWHQLDLVEDWDRVPLERPWSVVLVDHAPAERRREEVRRLAPWAELVIVHDTCGRDERRYQYQTVFPLYAYAYQYRTRPRTSVLSNTLDVRSWAWS